MNSLSANKRMLVTISYSFTIRYLYRTGMLHKMRSFCEPVVALTWNQPDLIEELEADGFEVHVIPESKKGDVYSSIRRKIDYWFKYFALKSPTKNIEPRYLEKFWTARQIIIRRTREYYNYFMFLLPGYTGKIFNKEKQLLETDTNYHDMLSLVDSLNVDAVFTVTPYHSQEDILLRAAKARGKKMYTSILSFDNVVKRGWLPVNYDCYLIWNKYNANEVRRIYKEAVKENNDNVHIVGAAQFDFYQNPEYILPREEWLQLVGLPNTARKIILYAGGPLSLFPQEPQFLQHINEALNKGLIKDDPIVLFRCHPIDKIDRWKKAIKGSEHIYFDTSWTGTQKLTYANITKRDIAKLCSTLYYTDVHINLSSTMTVDGSVYNKPQIGPAYDEWYPNSKHPLITYYYQEYYLPIVNTNGLAMAHSRQELIDDINEALQHPEKFITRCADIVKAIITYTDGKCTERVIEVLKREIESLQNSEEKVNALQNIESVIA